MATSITSTIFYLLHYTHSYERVAAEICSAFASAEDIKASSALTSCTYLKACLDEVMRLNPGIGGLLPRETLSGGILINSKFFPEGIDLGAHIMQSITMQNTTQQPLSSSLKSGSRKALTPRAMSCVLNLLTVLSASVVQATLASRLLIKR